MSRFKIKDNNDIVLSSKDPDGKEFKPFHETFKIVTYTMAIAMIYPNPKTEKKRLAIALAIYAAISPACFILMYDTYQSGRKGDLINLTRHFTIIVPFVGVMCKMGLMFIKRKRCMELIDIINEDHEQYNTVSEDYKRIARKSIDGSIFFQKYWAASVVLCMLIFPFMAAVMTVYSYFFSEVPVKYMVHDVNKPFADDPESRFDSPFFEIMAIYETMIAINMWINFTGYDGFFGIAIHHTCLRMNFYCHKLEKAFRNDKDLDYIKEQIGSVVKDQQLTIHFVSVIQDTFNIWLGIIFMATVIQICTVMFQIIEGQADLRYFFLFSGSIIHIFLPCRNASILKTMSVETATRIYCCGWENVNCIPIRRMIAFMIARAQAPLEITAYNMFSFDMELFVSLLKNAYSMFTLIRD